MVPENRMPLAGEAVVPPVLLDGCSVENQVHDNMLEVESETKRVMQMSVCVFHIKSLCGQLHHRVKKTPLYRLYRNCLMDH